MYVITPTGDVLHFPAARHSVPQPSVGNTELFCDTTCAEWVATVPNTWAVTSLPPTPPAEVPQAQRLYQEREAKKRTVWLFGFIPLVLIA